MLVRHFSFRAFKPASGIGDYPELANQLPGWPNPFSILTFHESVVLRMFFSVGLCTKKLLNTSLVFSLVFLVWCLEFLSKILVTRCQGGRNGARDPLRRTECQKALVARREPAKLGTGSLFLVAEDCSEVKGTYDSGGRWREYLPSLEGIQEDCRVWGQRSKGRGGLSVTQLFWETKRKEKKGVGW